MNASEYDAWYDTDRGRWIGETEYRLLTELLTPQFSDHVLDVGCGTGWFTRRIAGLAGVEVTGTDIDSEALAFAREHDTRAHYMEADARRLPFANNRFHKVMSVTALCFIADWPQALSEIVRVTGDRFAVGVLNRHSLLWREKGRDGGSGAYRGAHWHTHRELRQALAGLPVYDLEIRTAVLLPSGSPLARQTERCLAGRLPFGSFLLAAGRKISQWPRRETYTDRQHTYRNNTLHGSGRDFAQQSSAWEQTRHSRSRCQHHR